MEVAFLAAVEVECSVVDLVVVLHHILLVVEAVTALASITCTIKVNSGLHYSYMKWF